MQRSTHSSQIYTFGPAISFQTSFCVFVQNEHLRILDRLFRTRDHMSSTNLTPKLTRHGQIGPLRCTRTARCPLSDGAIC